jgi:carboxymethylenebutenolidase
LRSSVHAASNGAAKTAQFTVRKDRLKQVIAVRVFLLAMGLSVALTGRSQGHMSGAASTVIVPSGGLELRARLFYPRGQGPFPAVLFNHGSGHTGGVWVGGREPRHPELLGPVFARHGYVFLYLYRRGDGLSAGQGIPSGDVMDDAFASGGQVARNQIQLRLLEGDEMNDVTAGLAYLRALQGVDPMRIAVVGHSFGGSLTVLLAEHDPSIRAIVTFGAGGYSWVQSAPLRARLTTAVGRMSASAFFIHAENDYSIRAGTELGAEMARLGKPHRVKIYPGVGQTAAQGHDFIHLRISTWEPDVLTFLNEQMRNAPGNTGR